MNIKIVTDSGSDITKEEAKKLGIELISMEVSINKKTYLDGDTISADEFYNQLEECTELPKTSQINPFRFEELFDRLTKNGDKVIAILLSSKIFSNIVILYTPSHCGKAGSWNLFDSITFY